IVNPLPSSPNLIIEAGTAILGTGVPAMAISQEVYVVNEETVVTAGTSILLAYIAKVCGSTASALLNRGHCVAIKHVKTTLENSCAKHTQAVKDCICSVKQTKDIMSLMQGLFPISKETAWLEAEVFIYCQKVALASKLKTILDSWVHYEQQLKESKQVELAKTTIERVTSDLRDEKMQEEILSDAMAELEHKSIMLQVPHKFPLMIDNNRTCEKQSNLGRSWLARLLIENVAHQHPFFIGLILNIDIVVHEISFATS
ncbi:hypothetical protein F5J12DRAFT_726165, partial [Pisolithus orientalis]|uniref:uncharacterized protein n=1 Tax=Pisolithus orientalis TaxID=936130 RepID=UPI002225887A